MARLISPQMSLMTTDSLIWASSRSEFLSPLLFPGAFLSQRAQIVLLAAGVILQIGFYVVRTGAGTRWVTVKM